MRSAALPVWTKTREIKAKCQRRVPTPFRASEPENRSTEPFSNPKTGQKMPTNFGSTAALLPRLLRSAKVGSAPASSIKAAVTPVRPRLLQRATSNDLDFGRQVVAFVAVLAEALLAPTLRATHGLPLAIEIPVSPSWQSDRVIRPARTIACVTMRSCRPVAAHEC